MLTGMLPLVGLLFYDNLREERREVARTQTEMLGLARLAVARHRLLIESTREMLFGLSQISFVREREAAGATRLFKELLAGYPRLANLALLDERGDVLASGLPFKSPVNLADTNWFQAAREKRTFTVGEYRIGAISKRPVLVCVRPLLDGDGRFRGGITASLNLEWMNQFAALTSLPAGSVFAVVDRQGVILARSLEPAKFIGRGIAEGAGYKLLKANPGRQMVAEGPDGVERLYLLTEMEGTDGESSGAVLVGIPREHVFGPARQQRIRYSALSLMLLTAAAALAWVGGERLILRPVRALVAAANRLRAGELSARSALDGGTGELHLLSHTFNEMAASLERREAEQREMAASLERREAEQREMAGRNAALLESLRESEERLRLALDAAQLMVWERNLTTDEMRRFGNVEAVVGKPTEDAHKHFSAVLGSIYPDDREQLLRHHEQVVKTGGAYETEGRILWPDGSVHWYVSRGKAFYDEAGRPTRILGVAMDVTARKAAEARLREQQSELEALFSVLPDLFFRLAADGTILNFRASAELYLPPDEFLGKRMQDVLPPPVGAKFEQGLDALHATGHPTGIEYRLPMPEGEQAYEARLLPMPERQAGVLVRNITERKRNEERLRQTTERMRRLALRLETAIEEERVRLSRELHDELGQLLTALKLNLAWCGGRLSANAGAGDFERMRERLGDMLRLVDQSIASVQQLAYQLRPAMFADVGLSAALGTQLTEFRQRTGIAFDAALEVADARLDRQTQIELFRICQEALTNVARHAGATSVSVTLQERDGQLVFTVADNGRGVKAEELAAADSLGLMGIRERALLIRGEAAIGGGAGGTTVTVRVPIKNLDPALDDGPERRSL